MFELIFKSSRSATFELINNDIYYSANKYDVYLDDKLIINEHYKNVFSLYDLTPNTNYVVKVLDFVYNFKTDFESNYISVLDYGAIGDGLVNSTKMIQEAINQASDYSTIYFPKGTYYVGPLFLKSNITLEIPKHTIILGHIDRNVYPILEARQVKDDGSILELSSWEGIPNKTFASIITGIEVHHVKIIGEGVIDENAQNSDWWIDHKVMRGGAYRPKGVFLSNCTNIAIQGITVKNTPSWNLHPYFSSYIDFIDMKLLSPKDSPNTDGCNPESCDHVNVIGVDFSVGDDCIAIKSGKFEMGMKYRRPTSDMVVRNCIMAYGHGAVVLGSEMSGGIKNLTVTKCYFKETDRGLRIKTRRGRGESAIIDDITFENIYMDNVLTPLVINMYYYCDEDGKTEYVYSKEKLKIDEKTPYLGRFKFKNMKCDHVHVAAGFFYGLPEQPIESIEIENVSFNYSKNPIEGIPAMMSFLEPMKLEALQFRYVNHVSLTNVELNLPNHNQNIFENVKELIII